MCTSRSSTWQLGVVLSQSLRVYQGTPHTHTQWSGRVQHQCTGMAHRLHITTGKYVPILGEGEGGGRGTLSCPRVVRGRVALSSPGQEDGVGSRSSWTPPPPPSRNQMTDACENITFPCTTYVLGNNCMLLFLQDDVHLTFDVTWYKTTLIYKLLVLLYVAGLGVLLYYLVDNIWAKSKLTPKRIRVWWDLRSVHTKRSRYESRQVDGENAYAVHSACYSARENEQRCRPPT